jgi:membrane associated rhomboid family serine protease
MKILGKEMKKLYTTIITATIFAIVGSIIDHLVWNTNFHWSSLIIGFSIGALLVLLSHPDKQNHTKLYH